MRRIRPLLFAAAILLLLAATSASAQQTGAVREPDPGQGNVGGQQGIGYWPAVEVDGEARLVDPVGCVVYLVPVNVNERLGYPCGEWFAPEAGRYTVWLEQGTRVSGQSVLVNPAAKFTGAGLPVIVPLESAGFAALAPDVKIATGRTVRFLSLEPSAQGFEKRLQPAEAHAQVRLPAGRAVAGIFDGRGAAVALSRPFDTTAARVTLVRPAVPARGGDLMLVLGKQRATPADRQQREARLTVETDGGKRAPDVMYETDGRVIAIWYGLEGAAKVQLTSRIFRFEESRIAVPAGEVTTLRADLDVK